MRWLPILILTPLLAFTPVSAAAQAGGAKTSTVETVVSGVEATYKDVSAIQASFTQTTTNAAMGDTIVQEGTVEIKRPRMMRWEFGGDYGSSFVTDGKTMWVYTKADNQVLVTKDLGGAASGNEMAQLLDGLDKLDELFKVSVAEGAGGESWKLELVPLKPSGSVAKLELVLAKEGYLLRKVTSFDPFGNTTELAFANVQLNAPVADTRFVFQPPPDATVVNADGL